MCNHFHLGCHSKAFGKLDFDFVDLEISSISKNTSKAFATSSAFKAFQRQVFLSSKVPIPPDFKSEIKYPVGYVVKELKI